MGAERIDVLAVMDAEIARSANLPTAADPYVIERHHAMVDARAAVAELIAADEVYDIALSRYFAAFSDGPNGDFGEQREAQTMLRVAKDRRDAALARVQGGTP